MPAGASLCVTLTGIDPALDVLVGPDRTPVLGNAFDPQALAACP